MKGYRWVWKPVLICILCWLLGDVLGDGLARVGIGNAKVNSTILPILIQLGYVVWLYIQPRVMFGRMNRKAQEITDQLAEQQYKVFTDEELPSKLEVHAALDSLIASSGQDSESMTTVVKFCSRIKPYCYWKYYINRKPRGGGMRGLTREWGTVELKEEQKEPEVTSNLEKTRVGQYKLWRDLNMLFIQYYWQADIATVANLLDAYTGHVVIFNPQTFEPMGFGQIEQEMFSPNSKLSPKYVSLFTNVTAGQMKGNRVFLGILIIR